MDPMARKVAQPPPEVPLHLTVPREDASRQIGERIRKGTELRDRPIGNEKEFSDVQRDSWTWSEYNEQMLRQMFTSPKIAEEYRGWGSGVSLGGERFLEQEIEELHDSIDGKIRRLSSVNERLELIPLAPGIGPARTASKGDVAFDKVFLVHGHDEAALQAVARFLTTLELTPIILHEQASRGRTIVEKLEHHGDVGYAVILLTPDDVGGTSPDKLQSRARQNVVLELGYFFGRLGRDRVCALYKGELELPSNVLGVIYIPFDSGGGWRLRLAKELKAAGFPVDMNKAI